MQVHTRVKCTYILTKYCSVEIYEFCHWIIILTYSIVQSPSWEASQEIPRISQNPKVHYRTHTRPPPVSILGQPNAVHIPTSHLLEIHPNIIHPSTPRSPQWSLSFRFPHQDPLHPTFPHPHAPHAQPISFFSILSYNNNNNNNNIVFDGVQYYLLRDCFCHVDAT